MRAIVLDNTNETLKAVLTSTVTSDQPEFVVAYAENGNGFRVRGAEGELNSTTEVTLVDSPGSGVQRIIKSYSIYNKDTADIEVRVFKDDGTNERTIEKVTISPGETHTERFLYEFGERLIVLDSTKALNAKLSGAVTTNQPHFLASYADEGSDFQTGGNEGLFSGTTEVTLVSSPASGVQRIVRSFSIYNNDTADVEVTLYTDDGTERVIAKETLNTGDTLTEVGVFDSDGLKKRTFKNILLGDSLDANSNKIINLAAPTNAGDATNKTYIDSNFSALSGGNTFSGNQVFNGKVGIGESSPNSALVVKDSISGFGTYPHTLLLNSNTSTGAHIRLSLVRGADAGSSDIEKGSVIFAENNIAGWADYENRALTFWTDSGSGATEKVRIQSDGKVGIGTETPGAPLTVSGYGVVSATPGNGTGLYIDNGTSFAQIFPRLNGRMAIAPNISVPGSFVDMYTKSGTGFIYEFSASADDAVFSSYGQDFLIQTDGGVYAIKFAINEVEKAIIDTNGRMGIGTSSPDTKLDVNGAVTIRELSADPTDPDEGAAVIWMSDGTGSGDDGDVLLKYTAGGSTYTINITNLLSEAESVETSTTSVSNTVTETTLYTHSIPADSLYAGNLLVLDARGVISNASASDDITINTYIGSTLIESFNPAIGNVTGASWKAQIMMTVRSIGATGSIAFHGEIDINGNEDITDSIKTIDTTAAEDLTIKVQWDNANASNQIDLYQAFTETKK